MDYLIQAYQGDNELLGSENASLVHNAKTMVKVNNALLSFRPQKTTTQIKVFSYTNLYNDKTYRHIKTVTL
jgi:hypothetical protein